MSGFVKESFEIDHRFSSVWLPAWVPWSWFQHAASETWTTNEAEHPDGESGLMRPL
jgi:hypothetical protein